MQRAVEKIVDYLEKKEVIPSEDRQIYAYGVDAALYTFISTTGLLLIGWLSGRPWETMMIIATFYTNQSLGGGFHATTHWRCFLTMTVGLGCSLCVLRLSFPVALSFVLGCASLLLMLCHPLVLHPNKAYLEKKRSSLVKRSQRALVIQSAILLCLAAVGCEKLCQTFAIALVCSAISRAVVALKRK